jgi:DNA-binding winged helix-turn-helix (wHTH) protein/Tol biopolymer transport system component
MIREQREERRARDFYEFGEFRVDPSSRVLYHNDDHIPLTPKVFDTLLVLLEAAGRVVTKEELLERVWPDTVVEEGSLTNTISALRKVLGSESITTVPKRGYRFTTPVQLRGTDSQITVRSPSRSRSNALFLMALVIGAVGIAAGTTLWLTRSRTDRFEHVRQDLLINDIQGLGSTGVSPDGRFIALIKHYGQSDGLVLVNVATKSEVPLLPPSPLRLEDIRFSRDGNSVYFRRRVAVGASGYALFRIPILGGGAVRVADKANSGVTFAPDRKTFAFIRWNTKPDGAANVVVVNPDGVERVIAKTSYLPEYPAWSPDGRVIVMTRGHGPGLDIVDVATGEVRPFNGAPRMRSPVWLPDGSGLLFRFDDPDRHHRQIGFISYPKGEFRRITADTNHYNSALTMTDDGQRIVTTVDRYTNRISIAELAAGSDSGNEVELAVGRVIDGVVWPGEGILASVDGRLLRLLSDGRSEVLIDESTSRVKQPRACGRDGLVYRAEGAGRPASIWWARRDGTERRALTPEVDARYPACSADGALLAYVDKSLHVRPTGSGGGSPRDLPLSYAYDSGVEFSPDFKTMLVATVVSADQPQRFAWTLRNAATLQPMREFLAAGANRHFARFQPGGKAFAYVISEGGVDNLYLQPLDGTAGRFITAFANRDAILDFAFSPDGRSVVLTRDHLSSDLVMIRESAP